MKFISGAHTPRWIIFLIDVFICVFAYVLAYLLRFEFAPPIIEIELGLQFLWIFILVRAASFLIGKTYAGIIRYTSTQDSIRIFTVITSGSLLFILLNQVRFHAFDSIYFIPNSIIFIEYLATLFALLVTRIGVKVAYMELRTPSKVKTRVLIYGAGESGIITKRTIDRDKGSGIGVVGFIDDNKSKSGKKLEGASIYHTSKADDLFDAGKVDEVIISIQKPDPDNKAALINKALRFNIPVLTVPPAKQWIHGELSVKQLRNIKIEDLLGREAIHLGSENVRNQLSGKRVVISGAAGSIGSELVRHILAYDPEMVYLVDQAETPMYELEAELIAKGYKDKYEIVIGDIRNRDRVKRIYDHCKPDIVYHAAAYKHVPLMEDNPSEAVQTNVGGTKNMAEIAIEYGVKAFVFISTDKAVNPTNVMGATKRIAELYTQTLSEKGNTAFITTRFGNVLGSNGSVIPLFRKQIDEGGPVTVTDKEVSRFFMTIPEAVQLVLEAGAMGTGGEIFVFDMGESIRIYDLAVNMVKLSGLELGRDIEIRFIGLRPGEKLHEELLANKEDNLPTHHPKILKAKHQDIDIDAIRNDVLKLLELLSSQNNEAIVQVMKDIVPEYLSHNSIYSDLDN